MTEAYPLLLKPEFHERVWGGRRLAEVLGAELPEGAIGESWSMSSDSEVLNGPLSGRLLGKLVSERPKEMIGRLAALGGRSALPLLFKIIDAQDRLSIQVHPDDRYALAVEGVPFGKTEAWFVLDAAPGSCVIHGFTHAVTPDEVRAGLADGSLPGLLRRVELRAGDCLLVPAGTVHAICGGLLLGEIQENSDITYRLYDWGRAREMHIERSLEVMHLRPSGFGPTRRLEVPVGGGTVGYLTACRYFLYQALEAHGSVPCDTKGRSFHVLFCYSGGGTIRYGGGEATFAAGQTVFIPAALGEYEVAGEGCRLLRALAPDITADVIEPLLEAGYTTAQIGALAGPPGNELERALAPACNI